MSPEQLKILADLTARLTEIKIQQVPHLAVENFAPDLFRKLVGALPFVAEVKNG